MVAGAEATGEGGVDESVVVPLDEVETGDRGIDESVVVPLGEVETDAEAGGNSGGITTGGGSVALPLIEVEAGDGGI